MSDYFEMMKQELAEEKTLTANGAVAYATTGKALLDFNFNIAAMRSMSETDIRDMFYKAYVEDPKLAVKYAFYLGDIRGGIGERKAFRVCLDFINAHDPKLGKRLLPFVPEFNRWDSVFSLCGNGNQDYVMNYLRSRLEADYLASMSDEPASLLAKWMPGEKSSNHLWAELFMEVAGWSPKKYRKTLSQIRKYLDVVEVKASSNDWKEIDYEKVPSKANLLYGNAFLKHDEARRRKYLEKASNGEAKVHAGVLQPHEIISQLGVTRSEARRNELDTIWKNLPRSESLENAIVVRDGSGSMMSAKVSPRVSALDVATALAIYVSEQNTGAFKDKFITFSSRPRLVDLSGCVDIFEKYAQARRECECSNTDIQKTMELILKTAVNNHLPQEEMPKSVIIISDMEFDEGTYRHPNKTLFENIAADYRNAGYRLPKMVFWNLNPWRDRTPVPMRTNDLGVLLLSGFSTQLMKTVMSQSLDPYKALIEILSSPRYDGLDRAIGEIA